MRLLSARSRRTVTASVVALIAAGAVGAPAGAAGPDALKPPGTVPGFVYAKWAADNIKRVYESRADATTECQRAQSRKLWLVRGTPDANGVIECRIPFGTPAFANGPWTACTNKEPPPFFGATDADAAACARRYNNLHLHSVGAFLDGEKVFKLTRFLITTAPFTAMVPPDNFFGLPVGPARGVGQGYFFYIAPLPRGVHELSINSVFDPFGGTKVILRIVVV